MTFLIYEQISRLSTISNSSIPIASLIACVLAVTFYGKEDFQYVVLIPILFGVTILLIVLSNKDNFINRTLSVNWLVYLGTISYGIYMIHVSIWFVLLQVLRFVFKFQTTNDTEGRVKIIFDSPYLADIVLIIGIATVLVLAQLSHKFIELKFKENFLKTQKNLD